MCGDEGIKAETGESRRVGEWGITWLVWRMWHRYCGFLLDLWVRGEQRRYDLCRLAGLGMRLGYRAKCDRWAVSVLPWVVSVLPWVVSVLPWPFRWSLVRCLGTSFALFNPF